MRELEKALGHTFLNKPEFLTSALTHPSFANENPSVVVGYPERDNQRMEFLGDSIMGAALTDLICIYYPDAQEGKLTKYRSAMAKEATLAKIARQVGLGEYIMLGKGEARTGGGDKDAILADALEAVMAAVFYDSGFDQVRYVVHKLFKDFIEDKDFLINSDPKTSLQEVMMHSFGATPNYKVIGTNGPDHAKIFLVEVSFKGRSLCMGSGKSVKEAEQDAAKQALTSMKNQEVSYG